MNKAWHLAYTRPLYEKKVASCLLHNGIEHFLPLTKNIRQWSDRKKIITIPLFPSYIFIRPDNMEQFYECLRINGVLYFIKSGGNIAMVKDSVIDDLKQVIELDNQIDVTSDKIPVGERLIINSGPFLGRSCETICMHGKRKMLVRIDLIQRTVLMDFPNRFLLPLHFAE